MINDINLDMKVTVMLFKLTVIVPTIKVEDVADEVDICMEQGCGCS
jgi:hypothetical protein